MNEIAPAAHGGQRQNQDRRGSDFTIPWTHHAPPGIRQRQLVLESIANKWTARGYYETPCKALFVLLEGVQ